MDAGRRARSLHFYDDHGVEWDLESFLQKQRGTVVDLPAQLDRG